MGEQGKINRPEHTAGGSQNKGTEKLQRRAGPSPLEAGGGGGERGKLSPRAATPSHPANRPRFLSKDFQRPDRRRALGPRREKARRTWGRVHTSPWLPRPLAVEGKGTPHPGRTRANLWLPGQNTASAPHTQRHLPAAPRPPRSRTELN